MKEINNQMLSNIYWQTFIALEREVLDLSYNINFVDENLTTSSNRIADLILRCALQIESLSKDLYFDNGGTGERDKLKFDYDCLSYLVKDWELDKKEVILALPNSFSQEKFPIEFCPFEIIITNNASGKPKETFIWNIAYQALKHDYVSSIKEYSNIKNLLYILAALYVLNLYINKEAAMIFKPQITNNHISEWDFKNSDSFQIIGISTFSTNTIPTTEFERGKIASKIFSAKIAICTTHVPVDKRYDEILRERTREYVYILKYDKTIHKKMLDTFAELKPKVIEKFKKGFENLHEKRKKITYATTQNGEEVPFEWDPTGTFLASSFELAEIWDYTNLIMTLNFAKKIGEKQLRNDVFMLMKALWDLTLDSDMIMVLNKNQYLYEFD